MTEGTNAITEVSSIEENRNEARNRRQLSDLPDDCLACIFTFLDSVDRKSCSLVCRRWLYVEGQNQHFLSIRAKSDLFPVIPSLFNRYNAVTKLVFKSYYMSSPSYFIDDDGLVLVSSLCHNLNFLKLCRCKQLTDAGMAAFAVNFKGKGLKELHLHACSFGAKGMNAVLDHSSSLEILSVNCLGGITDDSPGMPIGPGIAAQSLKTIRIKQRRNGECFGPLIVGSKKLRTLKISCRSGDWDKILEAMAEQVTGLVEIHLETLGVSDSALISISNCSDLEILHLVKTTDWNNPSEISFVHFFHELITEFHIFGWRGKGNNYEITDEGFCAIAKRCHKLKELIIFGGNPTCLSLSSLAVNCRNLERFAVCWSPTFGDAEISCIVSKFMALNNLCIMGCPVTDHGVEILSHSNCPNLVKLTITFCMHLSDGRINRLKADRASLTVNSFERNSGRFLCPFWEAVTRYLNSLIT